MTTSDQYQSAPFSDTHAAPAADAVAEGAPRLPLPAHDDGLLPLAIPENERRGRGKPKGSVNIRTNQTFMAAVSRYGDPLIASIAIGNMDPLDLIRWLRTLGSDGGMKVGATVMDVLRFQAACRAEALPYGHAKRAASDDKGNTVVPVIGIGTFNQQVNVAGGGVSLDDFIPSDQELSDLAARVSHDEKSHDSPSD